MNQNIASKAWQTWTIANLIVSGLVIVNGRNAIAQVIPDNTLGDESSVVNPRDATSDSIDGGARRGQNLFHSFQEFNVDAGRGVYFSNPDAVNNIFSRVTGNNVSNILGTLGVDGAANLFLINPNGIIFGANSSLDVQGSFAASTADGIRFGEQGEFSTINPQIPELLTVNPSAYLFNQIANQNINGIQSQGFLNVLEGENLVFLGGNINLTGSTLAAPGGRIELGGLQDTGEVGINIDGSLAFPENIIRGDILLSNGAFVDVSSGGDGFIGLNAQNLELSESFISAGIRSGFGNPEAIAGDIIINTTEKLSLDGGFIGNRLFGTGKAGDVSVTTGFLKAINGAQILANTFGQGNGGNVTINANDSVVFDGEDISGNVSGVGSQVNLGAEGNGGNVFINSNTLTLTNGAQLSTGTSGKGDGGFITINATDSIFFDGQSISGNTSSAASSVVSGAEGDAGNIFIKTNSLAVTNGAQLSAGTFGRGDGGSIIINANDSVVFDGVGLNGNSSAGSSVNPGAEGNAGDVLISTGSLEVANGAQITAGTFGRGDGGSITINATDSVVFNGEGFDGSVSGAFSSAVTGAEGNAGNISLNTGSLEIINGAQIFAGTSGVGDGGSITINAVDSIILDGEGFMDRGNVSAIFSLVDIGAEGNSGSISVTTDSLTVTNGAQIFAGTFGRGNGGTVTINATDSILFDGESRSGNVSGTGSSVAAGAEGNGGGIVIRTSFLTLANGAQLGASTFGRGNAGFITINATDSVILDGENSNGVSGGISSQVNPEAEGDAGDISIDTDFFAVTNGAQLSASTFGLGKSRELKINANSLSLSNNALILSQSSTSFDAGNIIFNIANSLQVKDSNISTSSTQSTGGSITITAGGDIKLEGNSNITTNVNNGAGGGGDIILTADSIIAFDDSDIFAFSADGRGGNITLDTPVFFGENFTLNSLTSDPEDLEENDRVDINATGAVSGFVNIPDVSFIQNSLTELPDNAIDTDELVANSCVVRSQEQNGTFIITGGDGFPIRPGNAGISDFSTGEVRNVPDTESQWQPGDLIIEPQALYRLTNGKLVLSRECQ